MFIVLWVLISLSIDLCGVCLTRQQLWHMNLVALSEVGSQCCGHVQVLVCDYCHVVYLVEREEVE